MSNLTTEQAIYVADCLHQIANELAGYMISNQDRLSAPQKEQLISDQGEILKIADSLLDYASTLVFEDIDKQMEELGKINITIKQKLQELENIQKFIEISASVLVLTKAIISAQPHEIVQAIGNLCSNLGIRIGDLRS